MSAETQNEQQVLKKKSNFSQIYLFPVTFYLLGRGNMRPDYWENYVRLNMT